MKLFSVVLILSLSGCAASRGFWVGSIGGPLAIDECVNRSVDIEKPEIHIKVGVHQSLLIATAFVLWPLAAAYGGASGLYGAYSFQKHGL